MGVGENPSVLSDYLPCLTLRFGGSSDFLSLSFELRDGSDLGEGIRSRFHLSTRLGSSFSFQLRFGRDSGGFDLVLFLLRFLFL